MTADDLDIIVSSMAPVMREFVTHKLEGMVDLMAAMERRMAAIEMRAAVPGPQGEPGPIGPMGLTGPKGEPGVGEKGEPGRSVDLADVEAFVAKAVAALPVPKDGQSITLEDVAPVIATEAAKAIHHYWHALDVDSVRKFVQRAEFRKALADQISDEPTVSESVDAMVAAHVSKAFSDLVLPKDGQSVTVDDVAPMIQAEVAKAVAEFPKPKDGEQGPAGPAGESVDPAIVDVMVAAQVERAVAAIPRPQDGTSVTLDDVMPLLREELSKAVAGLPVPKDGVGLTGALIDSAGELVVTLSDGTLTKTGRVVGEPGAKGDPGEPGRDGKDGRDGTIENIKVEYDGERMLKFCFKDGTPVEGGVLRVPFVLDRGVYVAGKSYEKGDGVSWGGSFYVAQQETRAKPGESGVDSRAWRLVVKTGAHGKTGPPGPIGPVGPRGEMGPQGRSGY